MIFEKIKKLDSSLKLSFEDEGLTYSQAVLFSSLANKNGLETVMKIGGAEAITDMRLAVEMGCQGCVAPMIESEFALYKYINAVKLNDFGFKNLYINIESLQGVENIELILNHPSSKYLKGIVLGRSDLVSSLGLQKEETDGDEVLRIANKIFELAKSKGLETLMGGNINYNSLDFIKKLQNKNLLDYVETRNVKLNVNNIINGFNDALDAAIQFEIEWLKIKSFESKRLYEKDLNRITNISSRKI